MLARAGARGAAHRNRLLSHAASVALVLSATSIVLAQEITVDPAQGRIGGVAAMTIWPQVDRKLHDPKGFEVVLVRRDDPGIVLRYPAGTWQVPPQGSYKVFLEGDHLVSPYPNNLQWFVEPFVGKGHVFGKQFVPATLVQVQAPCPVKTCRAWVLHADSNVQEPVPYYGPEMIREPELANGKGDVLMPAGRMIAAVYDAEQPRNFLALGTPVEAQPRKTTSIRPGVPQSGRAALILELERPEAVPVKPEDDIDVSLVTRDGAHPPGFVARAHRKVYAIWPDVAAGRATIVVRSRKAQLRMRDIRLRSGKVEYSARRLDPPPQLGVTLQIPPAFEKYDRELQIVDLSGTHQTIKQVIAPDTRHAEFEVPATPMQVTLVVGSWQVSEQVDLSDGSSREVTLALQAIRLAGRVTVGDDPVPATLRFTTRGDDWQHNLAVTADTDGKYETLLAVAGDYNAHIDIPGRGAPYVELGISVTEDRTLDFRFPANKYRVRVTNKHDGSPVKGASVLISNATDSISTNRRLYTDENGEATAQPLLRGTVAVEVEAAGFIRGTVAEEPVSEGEKTFHVALEPEGESDTLTVRTAAGPAAGAKVFVEALGRELQADTHGRVAIPEVAKNSIVLVRAEGAAILVRRWAGGDAEWMCESPAPPLSIRALHDGIPVRSFDRVLWLDGVRISGVPLAWLTKGQPYGALNLIALPPRPLSILLVSNPALDPQVRSGLLDAMRTEIPYPWPAAVDITVLQ